MSIPQGDKNDKTMQESTQDPYSLYTGSEGDYARHVEQSEPLGLVRRLLGDWVMIGIFVLTAGLCFGLGMLAAKENKVGKDFWIEQFASGTFPAAQEASPSLPIPQTPVTVAPQPAAAVSSHPQPTTPIQNGTYVASKSGTKYYLPNCSTAKRIKDANKVWFATKEEAQAAGYTPAANCKGL